MRKKLLFAGTALVLIAAAVTGYSAYSKSNSFRLLQANIDALTVQEFSPIDGETYEYTVQICSKEFTTGPWGTHYVCAVYEESHTAVALFPHGIVYPCADNVSGTSYGDSNCCYTKQ